MRPVSKKSPSKLGDERDRCVVKGNPFFAPFVSVRSSFCHVTTNPCANGSRSSMKMVFNPVSRAQPPIEETIAPFSVRDSVGRAAVRAKNVSLGALQRRVEDADQDHVASRI